MFPYLGVEHLVKISCGAPFEVRNRTQQVRNNINFDQIVGMGQNGRLDAENRANLGAYLLIPKEGDG